MALSPQLLNFKSSGVYRLEFDKSQTANINVETLRLIAGHSKKGPYNTPVLIDSVETLIDVFGNIDTGLEKKGMFFHRSCIEALSRGPILALNLEKFVAQDTASFQSIVTTGIQPTALTSRADSTKQYSTFFDNDKFMVPSDAAALTSIVPLESHVLNFVNIKQDPITVIVRQAQDVKEFDLTAREWYGVGNVPEYLKDFDKISDFMVDVFVFKGEFDSATMVNDPIYSAYFTSSGLDKTKLAQFANLRQVSLLAQYTGSILPGFKDLEGRNLYIESTINAEARRTGLFCAVDEAKVINETGTKVDLVGHTYTSTVANELLSHVVPIGNRQTTYDFTTAGLGSELAAVAASGTGWTGTSLNVGGYVHATGTTTALTSAVAAVSGTEYHIVYTITRTSGTGTVTIGFGGKTLAALSASGVSAAGEFLAISTGVLTVTPTTDFAGTVVLSVKAKTSATLSTNATLGTSNFTATYLNADAPATFPIAAGRYIESTTANRLAKVIRIAKAIGATNTVYTIYTDVAPKTSTPAAFKIIKSFEDASTVYKTFVLLKASITGKTISDYLSVLTGGIGLYNALIDKDIIDFRYVVDTFTSFDTNGLNNKRNLSQLAKDRQNASAILNAPTIEDFKKSTDPSFTDSNLAFNTAYIASGGNQDKNPTKIYTLPSINEGANYAFYYGPGLIVSDNGKDIIVPSAAYVSNNYIDKYTNALPWSIVAGPRRGVVAGTNVKGVEYSFDKNDRDILEPFGYNPIVFQRGTGLTILGNKTAQQSIKSALSSAHVREVLIYIEDGMAAILKDYVFEFNTAQTRLEIKTLADSFLQSVKQDNGVYEFKNVMDSTNNTNEVIDNNIGIIDTYVEPVKGLEIVVHRTTVLNTGEIQSGNL